MVHVPVRQLGSVAAVGAGHDVALEMGRQLWQDGLELTDGVPHAAGDRLTGPFGRMVGEGAGPAPGAGDPPQFLENR